MSICLPNLRSTSVFKVYYGGTGVTTLTSGGVMIGNGTDAVQCITGSEGQVLTWDSTSGSWVAKNPTGGIGGSGGGNVPDIVIAPANDVPTKVFKKTFSNASLTNKPALIDWENNTSGSFRICNYNKNRKYLTVYNDTDYDAYISVSDDENPKIDIDFNDKNDLQYLKIKYLYKNSSNEEKVLFDYNINQLKNIYSYHTHSEESNNIYGYGKDTVINECGNQLKLTINLTRDFCSNHLNKYNNASTGSLQIYLSNSSGILCSNSFNITSSNYNTNYKNLKYDIYTYLSGNQFHSSSFITSSNISSNTNGFDFKYTTHPNKIQAPEEYSYILYSKQTLTISEKESTLALFGYLLHPQNNNEVLNIRATEAV